MSERHVPGECPHELSTLEVGRSVKSRCDLRGHDIWTTCRDWGRCTLREWQPELPDMGEEER